MKLTSVSQILKVLLRKRRDVFHKKSGEFHFFFESVTRTSFTCSFSKPEYLGVVYLPTLVVSILLFMMICLSQNANIYKHKRWTMASTSGALFEEKNQNCCL